MSIADLLCCIVGVSKIGLDDGNLLLQGVYAVLHRHVDSKKARSGVKHLADNYEDWNEVRVAQAQEIANCLKFGSKKGIAAAKDVKVCLQEVFQQSHGIDLEFLREA